MGCGDRPAVPEASTGVTIKSDRWIKRMALDKGMIEPFEERQFRTGVISYGLSSYGYDLSLIHI